MFITSVRLEAIQDDTYLRRLPVVRHLAFSSPTDLPRRALRMPQDCTAA